MKPKILVIDQYSLPLLDSALVEDEWFREFKLPETSGKLRRVVIGDNIYILSEAADENSGYLVIYIGENGVFSSSARSRNVFERIIRVALTQFDRGISVPVPWQKFHAGSRLSVYAESYLRGNVERICFDRSPAGTANIYAFAVTSKALDLDNVPIDIECYTFAMEQIVDALITDIQPIINGGNYGIVLSEPLGLRLAGSGTLLEWYEKRLNSEQLNFVNKSTDGPLRLRGAAGTGKTQAMVVKCLRDLYDAADKNLDYRFAFLTHSSALAHEVVRGMLYALDPSERWANLFTEDGKPRLWIGTLYELAQLQLGYEKKGLSPLSLDGIEGRDYQRVMINDSINQTNSDARIKFGLLNECPDFSDRMEDLDARDALIEEIMNEFACSIDAENIRKGTTDAERYIKEDREAWQMSLPTMNHRKILLEIHSAYCLELHKEKYLSMDQMVADFGRYLSTHEWNQLKERDGFDRVFVDEYHYFTRVETMVLQNLFKSRAGVSGRWPLYMAYDLKQSTRDTNFGNGISRFRNPGVGESIPVDLKTVYRSSPQITALLRDLDGSFPAIDLEGEFNTYIGQSAQPSGEIPTLQIFKNNTELVDSIFEQAIYAAKSLPAKGNDVAVLCLNEKLFSIYRDAGRIQDKFIAITSREDMKDLRYAKNRCVFSMPEYVAGLQFDTVFLINCDEVELSVEHISQGARRRYVSRMYLGASRAIRHLSIASSLERGGPNGILNLSITSNNIVKSENLKSKEKKRKTPSTY
ncbi:UvrD-helicase domain-containing protein [Janthinobacterium sp. 64]|uniref:UvrD-helicase domain-containing protein n=1 Tax=Janthinobacterium sp. 64 TaxID=2035208 RepID=UPI000CBA85B8|nr:UvrD-helicase domain-containing protein [Janthinobacterium sp. 64]PKB20248.1 UvrD/REP helicase N-terminal domain-containing protein [Janthinobacterium sp. 64]